MLIQCHYDIFYNVGVSKYDEDQSVRGLMRLIKISEGKQFWVVYNYKTGSVRTNPKSRSRIEVSKHRLELAHRESTEKKTPEQRNIQGGKTRKAMQNRIQGSVRLERLRIYTSDYNKAKLRHLEFMYKVHILIHNLLFSYDTY